MAPHFWFQRMYGDCAALRFSPVLIAQAKYVGFCAERKNKKGILKRFGKQFCADVLIYGISLDVDDDTTISDNPAASYPSGVLGCFFVLRLVHQLISALFFVPDRHFFLIRPQKIFIFLN